MWLVLFIIYENFRFNRLFERHRRRLENARAEFPSLMVSINQILTDYDPIEMVGQPDFEDVYEGEAADIIYRLHANIEPTDSRAYLREEFFNQMRSWNRESAAQSIWETWQSHLVQDA